MARYSHPDGDARQGVNPAERRKNASSLAGCGPLGIYSALGLGVKNPIATNYVCRRSVYQKKGTYYRPH
jgi:hypothetical protein